MTAIAVMVLLLVVVLVACDTKEGGALPTPVLTASGTEVSWNAVEGADGYEVFVNDVSVGVVTETSFSLADRSAGEYSVSVIAKGDGANRTDSLPAEKVTVEIFGTLSAPVLVLNGNTVRWEAVANAVSYAVYVNGEFRISVTETVYAVSDTEPGEYSVTVVAEGNEWYSDSERSAAVVYTVSDSAPEIEKLPAPVIVLQGSRITWNAVANAAVYDIYMDGALVGTTADLYYDITVREEGDYVFTVIAANPSSDFTDSDASNAVEYSVAAYDLSWPTLASTVANGEEYVFAIGTDDIVRYTLRSEVSDFTEYMWYIEPDGDSGYYRIKLYNGLYLTWTGDGTPYNGNETMQAVADGSSAQQWHIELVDGTYRFFNRAHSEKWSGGVWQYYLGVKDNALKFGDNCSDLVLENLDIAFEAKPALAAPVVELNGNELSWVAVDGASGYLVYADSVQIASVTETSYTISSLSEGTHTLYVVAVPESFDDNYLSSPSNSVQYDAEAFTFLKPVLAVHRTNDGRALVGEINSDGWFVALDSAGITDFAPYMWYPEKADDGDYYYIKLADGRYLTATVFSNGENCAQALAFTGEDNQKWGFVAQDNPNAYKIINAAESTHTSYFGEYYGNFAFDAVCNAWNVENLDIPYEEMESLAAPVVSLDGTVVSWEAVENAETYEIYVNGVKVAEQTELTYAVQTDGSVTYAVYVRAAADGWLTSPASNTVTYSDAVTFDFKVYAYYNDANQTLGEIDENGNFLIGPNYAAVDDYTDYLWTVELITEGDGAGYYMIRLADGRYLSFADKNDTMNDHAAAAEKNASDNRQWWKLVKDESRENAYKLENVYYSNFYSDVYLGEWYSANNGNAYMYNGGCQSWTFVLTDIPAEQ